MKDYRENMFFVPLVHIQSRNWEQKQKALEDCFNCIELNPDGTLLTNYHQNNKDLNNFIQDLFDEELDLFLSEIDIGTKNIHSSWFEVAKDGSYHRIHTHGSYGYSAVCFVKFDTSEHDPTTFISPFLSFLDGNCLEYKPSVDEGSIIFFPSSTMHYTNPNNSKKERIILSFNVRDCD